MRVTLEISGEQVSILDGRPDDQQAIAAAAYLYAHALASRHPVAMNKLRRQLDHLVYHALALYQCPDPPRMDDRGMTAGNAGDIMTHAQLQALYRDMRKTVLRHIHPVHFKASKRQFENMAGALIRELEGLDAE